MPDNDGFSDFFYHSADGLRLHARIYGEAAPGRWPVVCLPGLTRNARDFHELALCLSRETTKSRQVIAFDYRGRGGSDHDPQIANYNVSTEAADVLAGMDALGIGQAAFIGTSRGGLIIHLLGAMRPAALKAIVLNDIGPELGLAGLAHILGYLDRRPKPRRFAETVEAQRTTHGADFPALGDADWERMARALYREEEAGFVPDYDSGLVETFADLDLSKPLPTLWPQFDALANVPMLTIRGENSRLLTAATLAEMRRRHPAMEIYTAKGQGHAPFLETGDLPAVIAGFIDRAEDGQASEPSRRQLPSR
jgi:pimeloyl-ACP methyl ester carboxylesterase